MLRNSIVQWGGRLLAMMRPKACLLQASGEAVYTSDVDYGRGELFAYPVISTQALATIVSIDASKVLKVCQGSS